MDTKGIIEAAREGFDGRLHGEEYRRVHSDAEHLEKLLALISPRDGDRILDLGTGNGYLAFELAARYPRIGVLGLDIARESIAKDAELAREQGLGNLEFLSYDGGRLPFDDQSFTLCASRYALHHFPDIRGSLAEIARITARGGSFVLSDPLTFDEDEAGFIDEIQALRRDGHVRFYRRREIEDLCREAGFAVEREFTSEVRFPRILDERYRRLLAERGPKLAAMYGIEIEGEEAFIRCPVMNIRFQLVSQGHG